jgi:hypothetical protein
MCKGFANRESAGFAPSDLHLLSPTMTAPSIRSHLLQTVIAVSTIHAALLLKVRLPERGQNGGLKANRHDLHSVPLGNDMALMPEHRSWFVGCKGF